MTDKKPNPSPRIYLAKRHRDWWHRLPRFERSKVVNTALDLYRNQRETDDKRSDKDAHPDNPAS
jgi:hypothetical protein